MWSRWLTIGIAVLALAVVPAARAADHAAPAEHGAAAHGDEGASAVNPLDFQTDLAIFTVVVFVLLLLILWKSAWKPIAHSLDQREERIRNEIAAAEKANADARGLLEQYQARLAAAENEVREIVERGRRESERIGREMLDKSRAEATAEKDRAMRDIETATSAALKELAERSATLAVELAGRILQAKLGPAEHAQLIEQAVERFGKTNGQRAKRF